MSKSHILLFQSFLYLLFPISQICFIIPAAFLILSLICAFWSPFARIMYPRYLNSCTSSIFTPFHWHPGWSTSNLNGVVMVPVDWLKYQVPKMKIYRTFSAKLYLGWSTFNPNGLLVIFVYWLTRQVCKVKIYRKFPTNWHPRWSTSNPNGVVMVFVG